MAATTVTDAGSVRIITEVIPATDPRAAQLASGSRAPARTSFQTQGFRRAHPKVLGVRHGIVLLDVLPGWVEGMLGQVPLPVPFWHCDMGAGMCLTVTGSGSISVILPQTIHIFTGIAHICFGIILTLSEHRNPSLPVASGVLFWLGILLSNGLDSILVLLGLLEFCVAVAVLAFGYDTVWEHTYTQLVREAAILQIPGMLIHPFLPCPSRTFPWISLCLIPQAL
uniref:Uncharacterized protein n=1 Tax=Zonotrichia albicollis TaxID=44394 RepID=A0A8D2MB55_ZONAL